MRIGIDIDDVVTNSSDKFKEYLNKYGASFFTIDEIEENMKYIMRGNFGTEKIKNFIAIYIKEILENVTLKNNVLEVLTRLKEKGFEIFFVTARGSKIFPEAETVTKKYLDSNKVPYDKIILNAYDKYEEIVENKIDIMIDDSVEICESLSLKGIKTYLFTTEINIGQEALVPRIDNWLRLEEVILNLNMEG